MQEQPQWAETPNRHLRSAQNGRQSFFCRSGAAEPKFHRTVGGEQTEVTMSGIEPWEKAADCERALQAASDPQQKKILKNLRYLWIALANECDVMSADEFARESEVIGRLHVELALLDRPSLH
jgi:hypothetical protein